MNFCSPLWFNVVWPTLSVPADSFALLELGMERKWFSAVMNVWKEQWKMTKSELFMFWPPMWKLPGPPQFLALRTFQLTSDLIHFCWRRFPEPREPQALGKTTAALWLWKVASSEALPCENALWQMVSIQESCVTENAPIPHVCREGMIRVTSNPCCGSFVFVAVDKERGTVIRWCQCPHTCPAGHPGLEGTHGARLGGNSGNAKFLQLTDHRKLFWG